MSAVPSRTASIARSRGEAKLGSDNPAAQLDALAARVETGFRDAAAQAVREAHEAGLPAAVLDEAGQPAWLHPDSTVRSADLAKHS